ncbi:hypothetical protein LTR85_002188 [Meristemomyces frigidus]|nr:hypothetical protein LTR85_002188 [Meristemomyces frigidus]
MLGATRSTLTILALGARSSAAAAVASRSDVDLYACYNSCYAIERSRAVTAIEWFCNLYGGNRIGDGVTGNYFYTPANLEANEASPHYQEQGNIFMSIIEAGEYQGAECIPSNVAPYKNCLNGMLAAVDMWVSCNTNTVQAKQGGWYISGCLNVTVDPNPAGCPSL